MEKCPRNSLFHSVHNLCVYHNKHLGNMGDVHKQTRELISDMIDFCNEDENFFAKTNEKRKMFQIALTAKVLNEKSNDS